MAEPVGARCGEMLPRPMSGGAQRCTTALPAASAPDSRRSVRVDQLALLDRAGRGACGRFDLAWLFRFASGADVGRPKRPQNP
jgi:hypothetical protein